MKRKVYNIIKHIPFGNLYLMLSGNIEVPIGFGSFERETGIFDPVVKYRLEHPDTVITKKLYDEIMKDK